MFLSQLSFDGKCPEWRFICYPTPNCYAWNKGLCSHINMLFIILYNVYFIYFVTVSHQFPQIPHTLPDSANQNWFSFPHWCCSPSYANSRGKGLSSVVYEKHACTFFIITNIILILLQNLKKNKSIVNPVVSSHRLMMCLRWCSVPSRKKCKWEDVCCVSIITSLMNADDGELQIWSWYP